mgnify:CR=1 FL=1
MQGVMRVSACVREHKRARAPPTLPQAPEPGISCVHLGPPQGSLTTCPLLLLLLLLPRACGPSAGQPHIHLPPPCVRALQYLVKPRTLPA